MKKAVLLFSLLISTCAFSQVTEQQFIDALNLAEFRYERIGENMFMLGMDVQGQHPTDPTKWANITQTTVVQNNEDHYYLATSFPRISPLIYDEITGSEKYQLGDLISHHFKKNETIEITKGEDNNAIVTLKVDYKGEKVLALIYQLTGVQNDMAKAWQALMAQHNKLFVGKIKEMQKADLTSMDNDWFPYLANYEKLIEFAEEPDIDGAIGYWSYSNSELELAYDLYNFEDRFEIYITGNVSSAEEANAYLEDFNTFTAKKGKFPNASSTEGSIRPGGPAWVGIKATFMYNGSMSVEDFT